MIVLIVKYEEQKWVGSKYEYITKSGIIKFNNLESVSEDTIEVYFNTRHIIEITQVHDEKRGTGDSNPSSNNSTARQD